MSGQLILREKDEPALEYVYNTLSNLLRSDVNNFDKHDLDVSKIILSIYLDRLKNKSDSENVSGKLPDM